MYPRLVFALLALAHTISAITLSTRIANGLKLKYPLQDITRVLTCWDKFTAGQKLDRFVDDNKEIHQIADCFVDGLKSNSPLNKY